MPTITSDLYADTTSDVTITVSGVASDSNELKSGATRLRSFASSFLALIILFIALLFAN